MFTLHGKSITCGFKKATIPPAPLTAEGEDFIPFPPIQSVSLNLSSGIQAVNQIGIYPLREIVNLAIQQPAEVTFSCILSEDYPYYPELISTFQKSAETRHFPLVDARIHLGRVFHDGRAPVIELMCGVARSLSIRFTDRFAQIDIQYTFPLGFYAPSSEDNSAPAAFYPTTQQPERKILTLCSILNKHRQPIFGSSVASVSSFSLTANLNNSFSVTFPNILQALTGLTPFLPSSVYALINEGAPSFSGNLNLLMPPEIPLPPVITLPQDVNITLVTEHGLVIQLWESKIQSVSPTLSHDAPIQFNLTFLGKSAIISHT